MSVSQLKRILWAMNEILSASTHGISREELSDRWANSSMNDNKEEGIPERTFHRIRRSLESVFGVEIECIKGAEPRYRLAPQDLEPGNNSLFNLMLNKALSEKDQKSTKLHDIFNLIMSGKNITRDDMGTVQSIARKLRRVPFEYGLQLIDSAENGNIAGADCAEWDAGYKRYVCVWNESDFNRTGLWLSIGIDYDRVLFYIVTGVQDAAYREKISQLIGIDNGEQHMYGYWWYEPSDKSLFQLDFQTFPDMQEVNRRVEMLIAKIAALPENIHKPAE